LLGSTNCIDGDYSGHLGVLGLRGADFGRDCDRLALLDLVRGLAGAVSTLGVTVTAAVPSIAAMAT
jgi:hypothetical protein